MAFRGVYIATLGGAIVKFNYFFFLEYKLDLYPYSIAYNFHIYIYLHGARFKYITQVSEKIVKLSLLFKSILKYKFLNFVIVNL